MNNQTNAYNNQLEMVNYGCITAIMIFIYPIRIFRE